MEEDGTDLPTENGDVSSTSSSVVLANGGEHNNVTDATGEPVPSSSSRSLPRINGVEEVLEAAATDSYPGDVVSVAKILRSSGVTDCEPAVLNQLLEFMHRYVCEVLADSLLFSEHAGRRDAIQQEDVQLAIKYRVDHAFSGFAQPPSIDFLREMAQEINIIRLPVINKRFGVMLPPDHFCLNETNYQVVTSKRGGSASSASTPAPPTSSTAAPPPAEPPEGFIETIASMTTPRPKPPSKAPQIPINLQSTITSVASGLPAALPLNFNT